MKNTRTNEVPLIIIHPTDPLGNKVSGIDTFLKGFIKYAPKDFDIDFIGISSISQAHPIKRWNIINVAGRKINFCALFTEKDENKKTLVPLSLRFTLALKFSRIEVGDKILFFNRIEPVILYKNIKNPKIVVIHTDIAQQINKKKSEVLWSIFPNIYFKFEDYVFNILDHIYVINRNSLNSYYSKYPEKREKFSILSTWVDTDIFYPADKSKEEIKKNLLISNKQLPLTKKWIIFAGRLQEVKAPLRLIETFFEYHKIDKDSSLLIAGEGNLRKETENYARELGIKNSVYFLGIKNQLELVEYYKAADIMLLVSNFEGMPMSVLEALGCGIPVVSTNVGEVSRVVKNGISGEVVDNFSSVTISSAIRKVLQNPGQYSKENCVSSIFEYSPQRVLESLYCLIRDLS